MSTGAGTGGLFGAFLGVVAVALAPVSGGATFAMYMTGATIGFTLGSAIGSYIDPATPDQDVQGKPESGDFSVTTCEEGIPVPDVYGTTKLPGNIFGYWNNRNTQVTTQSSGAGGKGGKSGVGEQVTGYNYYLSWAVGLCEGPVDRLFAIWRDNDKCIWKGDLSRSTDMTADGYATVVVEDFGTIYFYFGTTTQSKNTFISTYEGDDTICPAYRKFCYAYMHDCYIGDYNRAPVLHFTINKRSCIVEVLGSIGDFDDNPSRMLYDILVNKLEIDSTSIDTSAFNSVATVLQTECFGLSMLMSDYQNAQSYIENILSHIDGLITYTSAGLFTLKLLRADSLYANIPMIRDDYLLEPPVYNKKTFIGTINELKVQYPLRYNDTIVGHNPTVHDLVISGDATITIIGDYTYTATYGISPYRWSVTKTTENDIVGVYIDPDTGVLTIGLPEGGAVTGYFAVSVTDSVGSVATKLVYYDIA
jgi:hypothetical protein